MTDVDVVVIGAGLAGLTTAHLLSERGVDVLVLEAKGRVGGRLLNQRIGGTVVDGGGSWVGPPQREVLALIEKMGMSTFAHHDDGQHILEWDGQRRLFTGDTPPLNWAALADLGIAMWRLDRTARAVCLGDPWRHPDAERLDSQTFGGWMRRNTRTRGARFFLDLATLTSFGCRPDELSLLGFLVHVGSAGGLQSLIGVRGGALESHIVGGAGGLCEQIAARLGDRVRLNTAVLAIDQTDTPVRVRTVDGEFWARQVVLAVDPATADRIGHRPALPAQRIGLERTYALGTGIKAHFCYDKPFWRVHGLSGTSYANKGIARITFDVGAVSGPGILATFLGEPVPEHGGLMDGSAERRRDAALAELVARFGEEAAHPVDYVEQNWSHEPFQSGCVPRPAPGVITASGDAFTRQAGNLHFAGAETAREWEGHMEGAVRSAQRVVAELV